MHVVSSDHYHLDVGLLTYSDRIQYLWLNWVLQAEHAQDCQVLLNLAEIVVHFGEVCCGHIGVGEHYASESLLAEVLNCFVEELSLSNLAIGAIMQDLRGVFKCFIQVGKVPILIDEVFGTLENYFGCTFAIYSDFSRLFLISNDNGSSFSLRCKLLLCNYIVFIEHLLLLIALKLAHHIHEEFDKTFICSLTDHFKVSIHKLCRRRLLNPCRSVPQGNLLHHV